MPSSRFFDAFVIAAIGLAGVQILCGQPADQQLPVSTATGVAQIFLGSGHSHNKIMCLLYSPDGRTLVSGGDDLTVKLWDTGTGQLLRTLPGVLNTGLQCGSFSHDGKFLVSKSDNDTLKLWDIESGVVLHSFRSQTNDVASANFSQKGTTASVPP